MIFNSEIPMSCDPSCLVTVIPWGFWASKAGLGSVQQFCPNPLSVWGLHLYSSVLYTIFSALRFYTLTYPLIDSNLSHWVLGCVAWGDTQSQDCFNRNLVTGPRQLLDFLLPQNRFSLTIHANRFFWQDQPTRCETCSEKSEPPIQPRAGASLPPLPSPAPNFAHAHSMLLKVWSMAQHPLAT